MIYTSPANAVALSLARAGQINDLDAAITAAFAKLYPLYNGFVQRPKFRWKDADEIYIGPGAYHHNGASDQGLYWDSELTFAFGSAGSNVLSTDLGASEWHYVYLDDSAIATAGTNLITASQLLNNTTVPTYNVAKHGWYNGNDRCIFGALTDGTNNLLEFFNSSDIVVFADEILSMASTDVDNNWDTVATLDIPGFCTKAQIAYSQHANGSGSPCQAFWRTHGQTGTIGHRFSVVYTNVAIRYAYGQLDVVTSSDQKIGIRHGLNSTDTIAIDTAGWYFPEGM